MQKKNVISLVIDSQQAGSLGVYGNTWLQTPAWNQLACDSLVCDFAYSSYQDLNSAYDAYWMASDAIYANQKTALPQSLPKMLTAAGYRCVLLTDEPQVAHHAEAEGFDEIELLPTATDDRLAETIEETQFAKLIAAAGELLQSLKTPTMLWIHSRGMTGPWDAPYSYREQFVEEEDPQPDESSLVPSLLLESEVHAEDFDGEFDDDELLLHRFRYAGQVACVDRCLEMFLDLFQQSPHADDTLLSVTSPRGFALGEHQQLGHAAATLHEEQIHVPWLVQLPKGETRFARTDRFVMPIDLAYTILDYLELSPQQLEQNEANAGGKSILPLLKQEVTNWRDRIYLQADCSLHAIRTSAWHCIAAANANRLYLKPDDRWEVNDLSDRCREIVEKLVQTLQTDRAAIAAGNFADIAELDQSLRFGLE